MKRHLFLFAAVLALLFLAAPAWAQFTSVHGKVVDRTGQPLVNAKINIVSGDSGRKYSLTTDKKGEFYTLGVQPGVYKVSVTSSSGDFLFSDTYQFALSAPNGVNEISIDLANAQKGTAMPSTSEVEKMTPEQQKALEEKLEKTLTPEERKEYEKKKSENEKIEKQNSTIKVLNEKLVAANTAAQAKDYNQAISLMKEANTIDPSHDLVWGRLGDYYLASGQSQNAVDAYNQAIKLIQQEPAEKQNKANLAAYTNQLGAAQAGAGDTQAAVATFDKAAELDPARAATYYFNEGAVMTNVSTRQTDATKKTAELKAANDAFDKAVAAKPDYAEAWYQKGLNLVNLATYDQSGKITPAPGTVEAFNKYLELQPQGPHADEAKGIITELGGTVQTSYGTKKKGK